VNNNITGNAVCVLGDGVFSLTEGEIKGILDNFVPANISVCDVTTLGEGDRLKRNLKKETSEKVAILFPGRTDVGLAGRIKETGIVFINMVQHPYTGKFFPTAGHG